MTPLEQADNDKVVLESGQYVRHVMIGDAADEYVRIQLERGYVVEARAMIGLVNHRKMRIKVRRKRSSSGRY